MSAASCAPIKCVACDQQIQDLGGSHRGLYVARGGIPCPHLICGECWGRVGTDKQFADASYARVRLRFESAGGVA